MKNSYVKKLTLITTLAIIAVAGSVLAISYSLSYRALVEDMRIRTQGVSEQIAQNITLQDIRNIDENNTEISNKLITIKTEIQNYINIENLYLIRVNPGNELISTDPLPTNNLYNDLITAITDKKLITSDRIHSGIFGAYWPVLNTDGGIEGVVCMEFETDGIETAHKNMLLYSIAISVLFLIFIAITARLIMSKTSDDFYKKLAYTDILTGLDNRMAFETDLIKAEKEAKQGKPTAIMVFDLNNLKTVNDALGHKDGDILIKNTADIIKSHIKQYGRLYRVGGDEFAAILTNLNWKDLNSLINKIHSEKKEVMTNHPFSCAAGMSRYDKTNDQSLHDTFRRADDAMYENKRTTKIKTLDIDERELSNIEKLRQAAQNQSISC